MPKVARARDESMSNLLQVALAPFAKVIELARAQRGVVLLFPGPTGSLDVAEIPQEFAAMMGWTLGELVTSAVADQLAARELAEVLGDLATNGRARSSDGRLIVAKSSAVNMTKCRALMTPAIAAWLKSRKRGRIFITGGRNLCVNYVSGRGFSIEPGTSGGGSLGPDTKVSLRRKVRKLANKRLAITAKGARVSTSREG